MAKAYSTPEGLVVTEKVNIKEFGKRLSAKLKEFEKSLDVFLLSSACAEGPKPAIKVAGSLGELGTFDPDTEDFERVSEEAIKRLAEGSTLEGKEESTRFQREMSLVPPDVKLETIKLRRERDKDSDCKLDLKYGNAVFQWNSRYNPKCKNDLVPGKTVVITVRIYWPFRPRRGPKNAEPKFSQEIVMLGHHTLDLLRDMITCVTDTAVPGELSEDPKNLPSVCAKDVYKSGFFFIDDTFYNDLRHPDNLDYSAVIREWAESKRLGQFLTWPMESTRVGDLTVQLGYPYVYQHQGDCEHLLTFSDLRLLHGTEDRSSSRYPYVRLVSNRRMKYCMMCGKFPSTWITEENSRVPFDPCFFCDICFQSFNYVDGKKVGEFKAFAYKDSIWYSN